MQMKCFDGNMNRVIYIISKLENIAIVALNVNKMAIGGIQL